MKWFSLVRIQTKSKEKSILLQSLPQLREELKDGSVKRRREREVPITNKTETTNSRGLYKFIMLVDAHRI